MSKFQCGILFLAFLLCLSQGVRAETDAAASVYGAFNSSTSANGTRQSPSNAAGILLELRHIRNPLIGYEFTYSLNRANQTYSSNFPTPASCPAPGPCGPITATATVPANAHEVTADWVVSLKIANIRPFLLAGGGLLIHKPATANARLVETRCDPNVSPCLSSTSTTPTSTQVTGLFVYGAGADWTLLPHIGLRFQYRANVYKAPDLVRAFRSTDSFTHNAEPVAGVFFQF